MKKVLFVALLAAASLPLSHPVWADQDDGPKMEEMKERRLDHLTKELSLTPDQRKSVEAALDSLHEKLKAAHEDFRGQINAVLNDEQKVKFAKMKEDRKEERTEHRRENLKDIRQKRHKE
jgi:Spy/CpxP family protein refolding chaperone